MAKPWRFVLDGDQAHYIDERSGQGLGVRIEVGRRTPLHCTAAGKALLAFLDPAISRGLLDQLSLDAKTAKTITDMMALQADLTLTRARGYAVSLRGALGRREFRWLRDRRSGW